MIIPCFLFLELFDFCSDSIDIVGNFLFDDAVDMHLGFDFLGFNAENDDFVGTLADFFCQFDDLDDVDLVQG